MISQDDIDAFEAYNPAVKSAAVYKITEEKAKNLAYEFHPDHLYDLLLMATHFGKLLSREQMMKIAYEARLTWNEEHN